MTICDFVAPEQGTEKVISDNIARRLLSDAMFFFGGDNYLLAIGTLLHLEFENMEQSIKRTSHENT